MRGSVEGAARGSRASREGRLITSQTRAEPSGIDRVAAKEPVTRGWSSSHPAHARVPHRIHGRHRGSNMPMSRQDLTLVRTAQSHRLLVTCPEGGGQPQSVTLALSKSTAAVARPSAMGVPTVRGRSRHPRAALRARAAAPAAKDRVTKSSGGRVCTSARKVAALRALVKTVIAADAGTKEPSQPKVAHSMPPSAAAPYTRSQGQRASSRNRPAASEATRAPRHRVRLPNAPSTLSGTAAATASAYPEQQPGRQPPRHHRGTTRAPPRNHPRATHGTRPRKKM